VGTIIIHINNVGCGYMMMNTVTSGRFTKRYQTELEQDRSTDNCEPVFDSRQWQGVSLLHKVHTGSSGAPSPTQLCNQCRKLFFPEVSGHIVKLTTYLCVDRDKKFIQNFLSENLKGRDHKKNLDVDGRIISE
jgi:hypothetical protein